MTYAAMQAVEAERQQARASMQPMFDKLAKGERLSVGERTAFDAANVKITECEAELRTMQAAADLAAAGHASNPAPEREPGKAWEEQFRDYLRSGRVGSEMRAMGDGAAAIGPAGSPTNGAQLVAPAWWQRLQIALKAFGGTSNDFQEIETETGAPMFWATNDPTSTVATQLGSNPIGSPVSAVDFTFGQGVLNAYTWTSGVQNVSLELANDSAFDIDGFVTARVGESLGRGQAQAAISGTGSNAPLGIITALNTKGVWSAGGSGGYVQLGTATKVPMTVGDSTSTELNQNTIAPSTLRAMVAAVDVAYRNLGAKFYMSDTQLLGLRGQVDANGRPLINLQDGLTPGAPSTLWGYEIVVDNNIPVLTASTVGGPIFGHLMSAMVLRRVNQNGILRLVERYADLLQVGFIGYNRWDIRSNDLRAAVTVKASTT